MTETCSQCGKARAPRVGSLTAYFFQHNYCQCDNKKRSSFISQSKSENRVCLNCGKSSPEDQKAGSFTAFLFKELRCHCSRPKFATDMDEGGGRHTRTAERSHQRRQQAKSMREKLAAAQVKPIGPGTVIGGCFKIESIIGQGGMGVVYLARHIAMQKQFALKVLSPNLVSEKYWLRFQAEARTLSSLNHPNLVNVYDLGIHDQSVFYYSMDYLKGHNLEDILQLKGPQSLDMTIDIFLAVLDGLAYAHRNGIVHRDIKPANIFICKETRDVKILDFGISKLAHAAGGKLQLTAAGEIFGSPYYMSPEQCAGAEIDFRSDIYSVGCSMFESLTGYVPFEAKSAVEIAMLHEEKEPPLLSEFSKQEFPSMDFVIGKCLAKLPRDRYQSAKELALDLQRVREGKVPTNYLKSNNRNEKEQQSSPGEKSQRNLKPVIISLALICVAVGLALAAPYAWQTNLRNSPNEATTDVTGAKAVIAPSRTNSKKGEDTLEEGVRSFELPTENTSKNIKSFLNTNPGFYSRFERENGEIIRIFQFPEGISLGTISISHRPLMEARGLIKLPPHANCSLRCGVTVANYPQLLQYFRPNDLDALSFSDSTQTSTMVMQYIARLTGLEQLFLDDLELDKNCIQYLDGLNNLRGLSVIVSGESARELAKHPILLQVRKLGLNDSTDLNPVLQTLVKSSRLEELSLRTSVLSREDFQIISSFQCLDKLSLTDSVTNEDLEQLSKLKTLHILEIIRSIKLDANCLNSLLKFKSLREVVLPEGLLDPAEQKKLQAKFPKLKIHQSEKKRPTLIPAGLLP